MSIYRSEAGKRKLLECYDAARKRLAVPVDDRTVETRHGETHLLLAGSAEAPPLIVFHGGNATNPMTLSWYTDLADDYRLVAPDTIGQPGRSAPTRVDPRGDGFGEWAADVLDACDIDRAPMLGTSYGAGIVLRAAADVPSRVDRAALVVPAGFGTGSIPSLARVGLPAVLYRYLPREWFLERVCSAMMTEPNADPVARRTIAASLRYVSLEREFPGASAAELADFDTPVALVAAENDPFFSADVVVPRARERLRNLARVEVLDDERHILSKAGRRQTSETIRSFLTSRDGQVT